MSPDRAHFLRRVDGTAASVADVGTQIDVVVTIAETMLACVRNGGTIYTCGNGGSAAEAMHLAEELIGNYADRSRGPRSAVCLNGDATALTCIANDFGFENVFARQCEALVDARDVLVVLSTSGNSENIVRALQTARERGATTVGLLGKTGGRSGPLCDHAFVSTADHSAHIQEAHLVVVHLLCEAFEPG